MKNILITFFDIKVIVRFESIPQGQTVNQTYYVEILKPLREAGHIKGLNFGPTSVFSIMTMPPITKRFLLRSFWPKKIDY
jgi:hypothetical protein